MNDSDAVRDNAARSSRQLIVYGQRESPISHEDIIDTYTYICIHANIHIVLLILLLPPHRFIQEGRPIVQYKYTPLARSGTSGILNTRRPSGIKTGARRKIIKYTVQCYTLRTRTNIVNNTFYGVSVKSGNLISLQCGSTKAMLYNQKFFFIEFHVVAHSAAYSASLKPRSYASERQQIDTTGKTIIYLVTGSCSKRKNIFLPVHYHLRGGEDLIFVRKR